MEEKQSRIKSFKNKLTSIKDNLEKRAEDHSGERFSTLDENPFDIRNRNKRFSTYRSEIIHGVMLKPLDELLERESRGEGNDDGLLSGFWSFKDDEDQEEDLSDEDDDQT